MTPSKEVKVIIDEVAWRLSESIVEDLQGSLKKILGVVNNY